MQDYQGPSAVPVMTGTGRQQVAGVTKEIFLEWCRYAGKKLYAVQRASHPSWGDYETLSKKEKDYYSGLAQIAIEQEDLYDLRPCWLKFADIEAADWVRHGLKKSEKSMAYKKGDYKKYHASERMKTERAARNKNRRDFEAKGLVRKGDGKEIDHKNGNPMKQGKNLRVISRHENRVKQ